MIVDLLVFLNYAWTLKRGLRTLEHPRPGRMTNWFDGLRCFWNGINPFLLNGASQRIRGPFIYYAIHTSRNNQRMEKMRSSGEEMRLLGILKDRLSLPEPLTLTIWSFEFWYTGCIPKGFDTFKDVGKFCCRSLLLICRHFTRILRSSWSVETSIWS